MTTEIENRGLHIIGLFDDDYDDHNDDDYDDHNDDHNDHNDDDYDDHGAGD